MIISTRDLSREISELQDPSRRLSEEENDRLIALLNLSEDIGRILFSVGCDLVPPDEFETYARTWIGALDMDAIVAGILVFLDWHKAADYIAGRWFREVVFERRAYLVERGD